MAEIRKLSSGLVDDRDSAFPQCIQMDDGEIFCAFSVGGGQFVYGGSDWASSKDGGETWTLGGTVLPPTTDPISANYLKLTLSPDGKTIYAYGLRYWGDPNDRFGERHGEAVLCTSNDRCRTWSPARVLPLADCPVEVSHALLPVGPATLLAPAATLASPDRLGEEVFVGISNDCGETWPERATIFKDPQGKLGYWEQKVVRISPDLLMATAWTVTLGEYKDRANSFSLSRDGGRTWGPAQSTGIMGQTMTPTALGDDRLFVLYNRRYGAQGIVGALVTFTETEWTVHEEILMYDAGAHHDAPANGVTGVDELADFAFGFPTAIVLQDGTILATHWCVEGGTTCIRWTRLQVEA